MEKPNILHLVGVTVAAAAIGASSPSAAQEAIFVVRHAAPPALMPMDAIKDDTPLSESGHERSKVLAAALKDAGINAIYSSDTLRAVQTAEPLAKILNLPIRQLPRKDVDGLVRRLRSEHWNDRVLVVSHWNIMPQILKALGHPMEVKLERAARDEIFVVVPTGSKLPVVIHMRY